MFCPSCGNENHDTATFCIFCGARMIDGTSPVLQKPPGGSRSAPPMPKPLEEKSTLNQDRYHIERELGAGGMGRVLLAQDTKMKGTVVIKEMHHFLARGENREYLEKRFVTEAQMLFNLKHSGLPKVLDYFVEEANMYLVMEYVKGKDLSKLISDHPSHRIDVKVGLKWMRKVLEILRYLHNQNPPIIHRDIKPSNLMLTPEGEIFMLDFGIARTISPESASHTSVGTFGYASPEQFSGRAVQASDIFSVGATFHHLLSGEPPAERDPFDFPPLSGYRDDVPETLNNLILRMVKQRKEDRPQTVDEVLYALSQIRETNVMPPHPGADISVASGSGSLPGAPTNKMTDTGIPLPPQQQVPPVVVPPAGSGGLQRPPQQGRMAPPAGSGGFQPQQQARPGGTGGMQTPPQARPGGTGGMQTPPQARPGGTGGMQAPPPAGPGGTGGIQGQGQIMQPPPVSPAYDRNIGAVPAQKLPVQPQAGKKPSCAWKTVLIVLGILALVGGTFIALVVWYAVTHPVDNNNVKINIDTDKKKASIKVSPLPAATSTSDFQISKEDLKAIDAGVDSGEIDIHDAMISAVVGEDKQLVDKILAKGFDINSEKDGITPLITAVNSERPDMVDYLISKNADPNVKGMNGWTALHYAVTAGNVRMVESLMNAGANPDLKEDQGTSSKDMATANSNQEILDALKK
ncbi:MAG: protein kinase [Firmicutes bacterium]|nr:protein kinase [Bacillota bacterium]